MLAPEYREAYRSAREFSPRDIDESASALRSDARQWSTRFENMLDDRLDGTLVPEDVAIDTLTKFIGWNVGFGQRTMEYLNDKLGDGDDISDEDVRGLFHLFQETHFHNLSSQMAVNWVRLISGKQMSKHDVLLSQNTVAHTGVQSLALNHQAEVTGELFDTDEQGRPIRHERSGEYMVSTPLKFSRSIANEADTAIVLQDATLLHSKPKDPSIIIVPAPGRYEHSSNRSMNVDFIAIDALSNHVRGIQTKLFVTNKSKRDYNPAFVTMIDGEHDLGSVKAVRSPFKSITKSMLWPGLISAHHLLAQKQIFREGSQRGKTVALGEREREMVRQRLEARHLAGNTRPFNKQAAKYIMERLAHDMYDDEVAYA